MQKYNLLLETIDHRFAVFYDPHRPAPYDQRPVQDCYLFVERNALGGTVTSFIRGDRELRGLIDEEIISRYLAYSASLALDSWLSQVDPGDIPVDAKQRWASEASSDCRAE
jgi:hypothetical protein